METEVYKSFWSGAKGQNSLLPSWIAAFSSIKCAAIKPVVQMLVPIQSVVYSSLV